MTITQERVDQPVWAASEDAAAVPPLYDAGNQGKRRLLHLFHRVGLVRLSRPLLGGLGAVLMLHHVKPRGKNPFHPNGILEVTPTFLDAAITCVKAHGYDVVTLDEARARLLAPAHATPFVVFTFDDGYRDNVEIAAPIFAHHGVPFTVYAASALIEGTAKLWWLGLEAVIARGEDVVTHDGMRVPTVTLAEKEAVWRQLYPWLRAVPEADKGAVVTRFAAQHGVDMDALCAAEAMDAEALRRLAAMPGVTIGAHTHDHFALARMTGEDARAEVMRGADKLAEWLGARPRHFAYPYGDPGSAGPRDFALLADLGFETAVTTRKGLLFAEHAAHLTALPRLSLNGDFQDLACLEVLLAGLPFALHNRFRRLNVG